MWPGVREHPGPSHRPRADLRRLDLPVGLAGKGGNCVIHCGDCLDVMRGMGSASVDAVVTDPPYSSGGMFRGDRMAPPEEKYVYDSTKRTCRTGFSGDNKDQRSFLQWSILWMGEARRVAKPGGVLACFTDWRQLPTVTDAVQCSGWIWRGIGTWWKPGIRTQKGRMSYSSEFVVYATSGVPTEGKGNAQSVFRCSPVRGREKQHVAEKPVPVMEWILDLAPRGGIILDPFVGSGTTGVAAVRGGFGFVGIEADPAYCELAARRLLDVVEAVPEEGVQDDEQQVVPHR